MGRVGAGGVGGGLDNPIQLVQRFRSVEHHGGALPLPGAPLHHGDGHGGCGAEHLVPGWGRWGWGRGTSWCRRGRRRGSMVQGGLGVGGGCSRGALVERRCGGVYRGGGPPEGGHGPPLHQVIKGALTYQTAQKQGRLIWVTLPWRNIMQFCFISFFLHSLVNQYSKTVGSGRLNLFPLFLSDRWRNMAPQPPKSGGSLHVRYDPNCYVSRCPSVRLERGGKI